MAYIEVVIKIPEEVYNIIKESREPMILAERLIKKGIPLPQGRGRLIDADDIDNHIVGSVDTRDCPTIIEADRAESEDEE